MERPVRRILKRLGDVVGVKGSLVVTKDGMVIASHLTGQLRQDVVAAIAANVVRATKRAASSHGLADFSRYTLIANHGKMSFTDAGPAFLVVVMDKNVDLGPVDIEIESAAMRIRNMGEIRV
jgi:predicted regulator of Ras-like GTPase activity (Roadblock/LC7/MglB family)